MVHLKEVFLNCNFAGKKIGEEMEIIKREKFEQAAELLCCEVAAIMAVAEVESRGNGFLPDGQPKILFEPFVFGRLTKGKFNGKRVIIYDSYYPLSLSGKWSPLLSKYGCEEIQYYKLHAASALDENAALMSCSWGEFQIMGFNYKDCGFSGVREFVIAQSESEEKQLESFVNFIVNRKLAIYLRKKNWEAFALKYNGRGTGTIGYPKKLEAAYKKFAALDM